MNVKALADRILKEVPCVSKVYYENNILFSVVTGTHNTILMLLSDELLDDITNAGLSIISVKDNTAEEEELHGTSQLLAER